MKLDHLFLFLFWFLTVGVALAATNNFDPATSPLPTGVSGYWEYLIAAVSPMVVWLVRRVIPALPSALLPVMTPFIGLALGAILNSVANAHLSWVDMAKAGALAVFVRETVNQCVTKQLGKTDKP